MVLIANRAAKPDGWFEVDVESMSGSGVKLLVMPDATVLQMKRAVAQAEGTPAFQQALWAEGAEEELQNKNTFAESGLHDKSKVFLIKVSLLVGTKLVFQLCGDCIAICVLRAM
jgi:hypothetical protein